MKQRLLLGLLAAFVALPIAAQMPDPCVGMKATITIDRKAVVNGAIKTGGKWTVSGGAVGALIEPRVEADRWQSETFRGTEGTWDFDQAFKWAKCGHYGFRVYVYPSVEVNGHLYHCLDNDSSEAWHFDVPCGPQVEITHCDWECGEGADENRCVGTCVGSVTSGTGPYVPFWGVNNQDYKAGAATEQGPWSEVVHCAAGEKISFKVRDRNGGGKMSQPVFLECGAQAGKP
jgi:hypothetical protein